MVKNFSGLHPRLAAHLEELGWSAPTAPQEVAIPAILGGAHILLVAPTGHGKTESALIPVLDTLLRSRDAYTAERKAWPKGIKFLYVTPLRALNRDMLRRIEGWGKSLDITVGVRHGDTTQSERNKQSRNPPELLITTPETLQILFTGSRLRQHLKTIRWVVVDEVHELATGERGAQFAVALERLERVIYEGQLELRDAWPPPDAELTLEGQVLPPIPKEVLNGFQRIGLSATVGAPDLVAHYLGGPKRYVQELVVQVEKAYDISVEMPMPGPEDEALSRRILAEVSSAALVRRTYELLESHESVLFFSNTRDGAEILGTRFHLWKPDYALGVHHGSLSRDLRIEMEDDYKSGKLKALICTSSLELGIDVGQTDLVIQLNSPRGIERLMQRLGRAGHRAGDTSKGILLCTSAEEYMESLVLTRAARERDLPRLPSRPVPLEVLANQLISITQEYKTLDVAWVHDLVIGAQPFEDLSRELMDAVVDELGGQRSIWYEKEKGRYGAKGNSRRYFFENISMIRDEKTYKVIDISTRRSIGKLDEAFVLSQIEVGARFVLRGRPWMVIEVQEEAILVSPVQEIGNIPNWIGEDIPVRFETAMEVGALREAFAENNMAVLHDRYQVRDEDVPSVRRVFELQKERDLAVPTDKVMTLETTGKIVVVNGTWGTQVNETFARLFSTLLAARRGSSVGVVADAYRITYESNDGIHGHEIEDLFLETEPETLPGLLRLSLKNSNFVKWQLVHVARKFGALSRDLDPSKFSMRTLLERFVDLPLFQEALDKLLWERMDVANAQEVLRRIQDGRIDIITQRLSPVGRMGLESRRDLMAPQRADKAILDALHNRLLRTQVVLKCTNCKHNWTTRVERCDERPACAKCGAIMLTAVHPYREDALKTIDKTERDDEELKDAKRLYKTANLVATYGRNALLVLSARGVGPDAGARILGHQQDDIYGLLRDILSAELTYARTRGFWDK